jgi:TonB-linked SusC/RagA family outer membrane protein
VLKGPNAVALYGARAANGAVVITTRKGVARKGIEVEYNINSSINKALILTDYQHIYGQGNSGDYIKNSVEGWGPKMEGQMVEHWTNNPDFEGPAQYAYSPHHNFKDFFSTGFNLANTLTLTSGSDKIRTLFSYTNTLAQGIVETNKLSRNNFNLRVDGNPSKSLSYDAKLTYFNQHVDNRLATGDDYRNPMRYIYRQPSNISLGQAREFEFFDEAGTRHQHYWRPGYNGGENVYWMLNRTIRDEDRNRILGMGSLRYRFTDNLSLMVRSSFDQIYENEEYKLYNDTYILAEQGNYHLSNRYSLEMNNDFLLNYNGSVGELLSINASFGGNLLYQKNESINTRTNRLLKPNLFVINNTSQILSSQDGWEKKVNSLYGFATIGIKDFLFIDVTGRNDWSSTLSSNAWSYFYPSVGLSLLITDMLEHTPKFLTFFKIRASYAEVGSDTDPYAINQVYEFFSGGQLGYVTKQAQLAAEDLLPENTKSTELGFDLRLFRNRVGVDFTWYRSNTFNQLLSVPIPTPSGYGSKFINAGNMQNSGVEIVMNLTPVAVGNFSWDILANFAKNKSLTVELTEDLDEYTTSIGVWMTTHKIVVGEPFDQIYTRGFLRNEAGRILINDLGLPLVSPGQTMPMGHSNPDWTGGLTNTLSWKGITMSVLIDVRWGGDVFSLTEANLTSDGFSQATLEGRDGFVVEGVLESDGSENTIETTAEAYWHALGGRSSVGEPYRYDASFIRVREILLNYTWNLKSSVIQSIGLSVYGRNLGFLYNASGIIDPGMSMNIGNHQGVEGFGLPTSRTFGVNASFKF